MDKVIRFPKRIGKVATHPQFRHVRYPPAGYQILTTDRPTRVTLRDLLRISTRLIDVASFSVDKISIRTVARFLRTRSLLPFGSGEPIYVPSFPVVIGSEPWFIEIEDLTTLFDPFITNGKTAAIDIRTHEVFPIVRWLLEDRSCLGIFTHIQETKAGLGQLFASQIISAKTYFIKVPYLPDDPATMTPALARRRFREPLRLFFNNSWHQIPSNFFVRGGLFVLNVCERLVREGVPIHLTIRSKLPPEIVERHPSLLSNPVVTVVDGYLDWQSYSSLMSGCHVYLLPAARVHVYSLLEAMYHGLAILTSDGWGIGNYITPQVNGLMLSGVYGLASWQSANGQLSEDYEPMRRDNRELEEILYRALLELIEDEDLRLQMATTGQTFVKRDLSIERFNAEFGAFLKQIL
jgi:glycosyltransferase involved in cell wall biosynthesis